MATMTIEEYRADQARRLDHKNKELATQIAAFIPETWEGIEFTERGAEVLAECVDFLVNKLPTLTGSVDTQVQIREEFVQRMDYLDGYGGKPGDPDKRFWVHLHSDWSPMSFSITWLKPDRTYAFNGGLIWHGGGNETFTVSLTPCWWGIHT